MDRRDPISLEATYTDSDGNTIVKQFRSLNQAGKFFSLNLQTLKELSLGGTPKLHDKVPHDLVIIRIPLLPKPEKVIIDSKDAVWHCDLCNRDIKPKSKYSHVVSKGHLKRMEQQTSVGSAPVATSVPTAISAPAQIS